jgi:hypothetical protein
MATKIWQVPNKSKAMADVFRRKSGEHRKLPSRTRERQQWQRELERELRHDTDTTRSD